MLNKAKRAISEWEADHKTYKNENQVPNTIKAGRQRNNGPYLDPNNSHDHDIPTLAKIADCHPDALVKLPRQKAERFNRYCQSTDIFI